MHPTGKAFAVAVFAVLVSGCNGDLKSALQETLRDPDSVKYEEIIRLGDRACIRYNAKNAYGGYVGVKTAHLVRLSGGSWFVESDSEGFCSSITLERKLEVDAANKASEIDVLKLLKEKNLVPVGVKELHLADDYPCKEFVSEILAFSRLRNEAYEEEDRSLWDGKFNAGLESLRNGECDALSLR